MRTASEHGFVPAAHAPEPATSSRTAPAPRIPAAAPIPPRRRRPGRSLVAGAAVAGLALVTVLPFFPMQTTHAHAAAATDDDNQHITVASDVVPASVSIDTIKEVATNGATGDWMRPVIGTLGDPFGPRPIQPVEGVSLFHRGQDIVAACGTTVRAAAAGTVVSAGWWGTYGNWILIDHGDGIETGYAHEEQVDVSVGQKVKEGQEIGLVGETGAATGCHLHLEVHLNGVAVNPVPFFLAKHASLAG